MVTVCSYRLSNRRDYSDMSHGQFGASVNGHEFVAERWIGYVSTFTLWEIDLHESPIEVQFAIQFIVFVALHWVYLESLCGLGVWSRPEWPY